VVQGAAHGCCGEGEMQGGTSCWRGRREEGEAGGCDEGELAAVVKEGRENLSCVGGEVIP
jgi:hypothetical protein